MIIRVRYHPHSGIEAGQTYAPWVFGRAWAEPVSLGKRQSHRQFQRHREHKLDRVVLVTRVSHPSTRCRQEVRIAAGRHQHWIQSVRSPKPLASHTQFPQVSKDIQLCLSTHWKASTGRSPADASAARRRSAVWRADHGHIEHARGPRRRSIYFDRKVENNIVVNPAVRSRPAPFSTITSKPRPARRLTVSGEAATRGSKLFCSFATKTIVPIARPSCIA